MGRFFKVASMMHTNWVVATGLLAVTIASCYGLSFKFEVSSINRGFMK